MSGLTSSAASVSGTDAVAMSGALAVCCSSFFAMPQALKSAQARRSAFADRQYRIHSDALPFSNDAPCGNRWLTPLAKSIVKQRGDLPDGDCFIGAVGLDPYRCSHRCGQQHHCDDAARANAPPFDHEG
jgi:hypothetical protein